jgi:hypothetical protein
MTRFHRRTFLKRAVKGAGAGMGAASASALPAHLLAQPHTNPNIHAKTIWHSGQPNPTAWAAANGINPIATENALQGTSDWQLTQPDPGLNPGDPGIEGFASATSIAPNEPLDFFVNTPAPSFDLRIYRLGYYGGLGGRLVAEVRALPGRVQPKPQRDSDTGLASCSNWAASHRLTIPSDWVSGVYVAKLVRVDTQSQNYILFAVREVAPTEARKKSDILVQISVTTYAAYNDYGGKRILPHCGRCTARGQGVFRSARQLPALSIQFILLARYANGVLAGRAGLRCELRH